MSETRNHLTNHEEPDSEGVEYGGLMFGVGGMLMLALTYNGFPVDSAVFYGVTLWLGGWTVLTICDAAFSDGCGGLIFLALCWCAAFVWWLL